MKRHMLSIAVIALMAAAIATAAGAAEITLSLNAIERAIRAEYFTVNSRHYLVGSPESECLYSFLEQPRLSASGSRLRLDMQFRAMIGTFALGDCRGVTDDMIVSVTLTPYADGSVVGARDVQIDLGGRDDESARMIREFLQQEIIRAGRIDLAQEIRSVLHANRSDLAFALDLTSLRVTKLDVTSRGLVLDIDFSLAASSLQPAACSQQFAACRRQLSGGSRCKLPAARCRLQAASCRLQAASCRLRSGLDEISGMT